MKNTPPARHRRIILRELFIALFALVIFLFFGSFLLRLLQISQSSLGVAGGIILFLIAVKMVFPAAGQNSPPESEAEPFIVPLAIPLIAGPSAMAVLMLLMAGEPQKWPWWLLSLVLAWLPGGIILLSADKLMELVGRRAINAVERLTGLILTTIAVEMFLNGLQEAF